jgi:hypothetical protein
MITNCKTYHKHNTKPKKKVKKKPNITPYNETIEEEAISLVIKSKQSETIGRFILILKKPNQKHYMFF